MKKTGLAFIPLAIAAFALFSLGAQVRHQFAGAEGPRGIRWAGLTRPFGSSVGGMEPQEVFETVLQSIRSDYVEKISDQKKLTYGAIEGMVSELHDPYSQFLTPERRKAVEEAENGQFHGLGAVLLSQRAKHKDVTYERLLVADVLPGSPAEKAGIQAGDFIFRINGKFFFQIPSDVQTDDFDPANVRELFPQMKDDEDIQLLTYKEAMEQLSADGKTVSLLIQRPGQAKSIELQATLGPTHVPGATGRMEAGNVGYLALNGFMNDSYDETVQSLKQFKASGAKSVVLDLRNSFGGPLDQARKVAALFSKGPLGYVVAPKSAKRELDLANDDNRYDGKVVLLVNQATLGTSELLAAALADQLKAPVVGTTTFGDGLDQSLIPLDDGSALQLTTGRFLTSSGADYHQKGIRPTDIVTESPAKQFEKALTLAKTTGDAGA